jgi:tRNA dimethylallyltransferase
LRCMEEGKINLITVLGHTAGGKTAFAAHLADRTGGEIISADSRQVYRGMDIGTGKDYDDYLVGDRRIPVHLIDIIEAGYEYNVYLFKQDFLRVYTDVTERGKVPILCGGSGLYIESVLRNYKLLQVPVNPQLRSDLEKKSFEELKGVLKLYGPLHNATDTVNRKRLVRAIEIAMYQSSTDETSSGVYDLIPLVLGIRFDRTTRRKRITERLHLRLKNGLVEEVERLMKEGVSAEKMAYYGLEYRYISEYLLEKTTYHEMVEKLNHAIHQFAKRQMTYFRGMERRGVVIHWLEGSMGMEENLERALALYAGDAPATKTI